MEPTPRVENDVVADLAALAQQPVTAEPGALLITARPQTVHDLERYAATPHAKRGTVALHAPWALARYVNAHKVTGTALFADVEQRSIEAVLNGHEPSSETPGWGDHRAVLQLRHTPNWLFWAELDGRPLTQIHFAHHVERGITDIVSPPGADLLEMAQHFDANTKVEFASSHRLQDGQRKLTYKETITARAGEHGEIVVPESFVLALAPFEGTEPIEISARLRYRISDGDLKISYELDRAEDVVRSAFQTLLDEIVAATSIEPYAGTAPDALR